jgi:predicted AAA+ superfamily ATPase
MYRYSLEYLTQWSQDEFRKPIVIRGARQVGKSTLVRMLSRKCGFNLVELNFERNPELIDFFKSNDPQKITQLISLQTAKDITPGKTLLFLDEIQVAVAAIVSLRYFYEELPELHVLAAGSLLEFTCFSMPVGRIEYLHLGVMTFDEFLLAVNETGLAEFLNSYQLNQQIPIAIHDKLMDLVKVYLITGGMPASIAAYVNDRTFKQSEKVKQSILSTYQDDFGKYAALTQHQVIRQVFTKIPTMIGNKFKYVQINPNLKSSTIAAALQQLCLARVAWKIHHSSANGVPLGAEKNDRQFVGQHLLYSDLSYEEPKLYYWVREKKSSSAE